MQSGKSIGARAPLLLLLLLPLLVLRMIPSRLLFQGVARLRKVTCVLSCRSHIVDDPSSTAPLY